MARVRKDGPAGADRVVRMSVPLDVTTYARLLVVATHEGRDRSAVAAEIIQKSMVGVLARDDRKAPAGGNGAPAAGL
jgi:hypothetical protein